MKKPVSNPLDREPSFCSRVEAALQEANDFLNLYQLMKATGISNNRVTASLKNLHVHKAADFIVDDNGVSYWFATPWEDNRMRRVDERIREEPGNRNRRSAKGRERKDST